MAVGHERHGVDGTRFQQAQPMSFDRVFGAPVALLCERQVDVRRATAQQDGPHAERGGRIALLAPAADPTERRGESVHARGGADGARSRRGGRAGGC